MRPSTMLKQVVTLKPGDTLSAKLLRQLDPPKETADTATTTAPATAATAAADTAPAARMRRSPGPGTPSPPRIRRSP